MAHEDSSEERHAHASHSHPFYVRGSVIALAALAFIVIYALIFFIHKSAGVAQYNAMNQKSLAIREFGLADAPKTMGYFTSYGVLAGVGFGLILLFISYIVYILARLTKWNGSAGLSLVVAYGLFAFYGFEFTYLGPGTVTWANGITAFIGPPLLWSSLLIALSGAFIIYATRTGAKGAA